MFAVIDTETTGGNPVKDRVMEIAIFIYDGEKIIDEFSTLINPETRIAPFIAALTGISDDMVKDAPTFNQVADKVMKMTEGAIFVAHNAGFDYSVIRREFKRIGKRFQRRQLCTVNLSERLMPEMRSYSLGNLCKDIGIKIENRHRAYGDARATVSLLELLLSVDTKGMVNKYLVDELEHIILPPHLSKETVDDLPEETGVYYLLNHNAEPLYIGRAKNIRKRVIDHLMEGMKSADAQPLIEQVHDIGFEFTGSELIAQLMEFDEVFKKNPVLNKSVRRRNYRYGIYLFKDVRGYINFSVNSLDEGIPDPIVQTLSAKSAKNQLKKWVLYEKLNPALCGFGEFDDKAFNTEVAAYNDRVERVLNKVRYRQANFFIIGEGRSHHEQSVVWVENYQYKGFGYFEPELIENDLQSLMDFVTPYPNLPEAHRFIKNWLRKKKKAELIKY